MVSTRFLHCLSHYFPHCNEYHVEIFRFFFFIMFTFNWRKIALQRCAGFCSTTMGISHNYTYICPLLSLSSLPLILPLFVVTEHYAGLPVLYSSFLRYLTSSKCLFFFKLSHTSFSIYQSFLPE